ncbi:MAG: carbohydrate-binding protein [Holophaga sp.]|nr:carbohydrate-binding protein [Holophaga sp.]
MPRTITPTPRRLIRMLGGLGLTLTLLGALACGGGGKTEPTTPIATAPAIGSFAATPATITAGQSSTLSWSVTGHTSLSINQTIGVVTGTSRTVNPASTLTYTLTATNAIGSSTATTTVTVTPAADTQAPSVPSGLATSAVTTTSLTLTWTASTDNVAVTGYRIFRDGTQINTSTIASFQDTGLTASTQYSYTVAAYDAADNISAQCQTVNVTTLAASGGKDAFGNIEAEDYTSVSNAIRPEACAEGGSNLTGISNGSYAVYNNLNFGSGAHSFNARIASANSGSQIEIRLDSVNGTLLGTCAVPSTGDWQAWKTRSYPISAVTGIHSLYLVFRGSTNSLLNLNHFSFSTSPAQNTTEVVVACVGDSITEGGYPRVLSGLLSNDHVVFNFGVSATTALGPGHGDFPYVNQEPYRNALASNPKIVIIKLGTNDSKALNWVNQQHYETDLTRIVTSFTTLPSNPTVFLCAPIPAFNHNYGIDPAVMENQVAPRVMDLVKAIPGVRGIDCFTPFIGHPEYCHDGIHPNDAGRRALASVIQSGITAAVDTTAPSIPNGLNALVPSLTTVTLSWSAATGEPTGYHVYRNGTHVAITKALSFTDTVPTSGIYQYTVSAFDSALNVSAKSAPLTVDTSAAGTAININPPTSTVKLAMIHASIGRGWLGLDHENQYGNFGGRLAENNYYVSDLDRDWDAVANENVFSNRGDSLLEIGTGHSGLYRCFADSTLQGNGKTRSQNILESVFTADNAFSMGTAYPRTLPNPGGENTVILFKPTHISSAVKNGNNVPWTDLKVAPPWSDSHTLSNIKALYIDLVNYFKRHPNKMFVLITPPPFGPAESSNPDFSNTAYAANARALNNWFVHQWLQELDYANKNVYVLDFYNVITGPDNHHRVVGSPGNYSIQHVVAPGSSNFGYSGYYQNAGDPHPGPGGTAGSPGNKLSQEFMPLLNVYYHRFQAWLATRP